MKARYRYRIEPTSVQRLMLARTFGCCRVVFNDALRYREGSYKEGSVVGPTEVQRHVITEAKATQAREWLSEVSSVALVQSVRDAHRAYQNFFDSVKGSVAGSELAGLVSSLGSERDSRRDSPVTDFRFGRT